MTNPNDKVFPQLNHSAMIGDGVTEYTCFPSTTKREEALLRFMCAITKGIYSNLEINSQFLSSKTGDKFFLKHLIAKYATELTEAYFNELNKSQP